MKIRQKIKPGYTGNGGRKMASIIITPDNNGWDISVYINNKKIKTTWAINLQQAYGKSDILKTYYTDDNGQVASVTVNN